LAYELLRNHGEENERRRAEQDGQAKGAPRRDQAGAATRSPSACGVGRAHEAGGAATFAKSTALLAERGRLVFVGGTSGGDVASAAAPSPDGMAARATSRRDL